MTMADSKPAHPYWVKFCQLRPALPRHVSIQPQQYRGRRWYILRNLANGRHLRLDPVAHAIVARFDGVTTLAEILDQLHSSLGDQAPTEDELIQVTAQLLAIDALRCELSADVRWLFERFQSEYRQTKFKVLANPLAIRLPLLDPDRLLTRLLPWINPLFTWQAVLFWLAAIAVALVLAIAYAGELTIFWKQDLLSSGNLMMMAMIYPVIKIFHELGHALAVKAWGGEVHEMGVTFLVLMPVPYVDASAAWSFREKRKRMLVGAAGISVELFIAAIALMAWLAVEPGLVKQAAFNTLLIASLSTLVFNANPLLRFDGYYVLQDWLEIPNLATRAKRYWVYLLQRYLLGIRHARSPVTAPGEPAWFLVYGGLAFVYRLFLTGVIALYLAGKYLAVGVALVAWMLMTQILLPLYRGIQFLFLNPALAPVRARAIAKTFLLAGLAGSGLLLVPVASTTHAKGIVWPPVQGQIYAGADGFLEAVLAEPNTLVKKGQPLLRFNAPSLETRIAVLTARRHELEIKKKSLRFADPVQSEITAHELTALLADLDRLKKQAVSLLVRSPMDGTFIFPQAQRQRGRFFTQGEALAYVIPEGGMTIKAVVPQSDIALVRQTEVKTQVMLAEQLDRAFAASIARIVPAGSQKLASRALGAAGGGDITVDGKDPSGTSASEKVFQVELRLPASVRPRRIGGHAYIRFEVGAEPLARQWLRRGRQLLLRRLSLG